MLLVVVALASPEAAARIVNLDWRTGSILFLGTPPRTTRVQPGAHVAE
ncbi:hypothetical protein [Cystobacter ferrugineus]|nr:hypothetical protein [Cystobacter ferrugineus]